MKKQYKSKDFKIEHYPESKKYYPTYKGKYLNVNPFTGIFELESDMRWADSFKALDNAKRAIKRFKEQQFKENIKIISVED